MKTLKEKKMLVRLAKMLGEPIDPSLLKSIETEERLSKAMFKEEVVPVVPIPEPVIEDIPVLENEEMWAQRVIDEAQSEPIVEAVDVAPSTAEFNVVSKDLIQQTVNTLSQSKPIASTGKSVPEIIRDKDIDSMKHAIADLVRKVGTLSWGGGGSGSVMIREMEDFDKGSRFNGRYMRWDDGIFSLAEINPHDVIYTTTYVTTATYTVVDNDYYVGVNYAGPTTITLPASPASGEVVVIKDESGNAQNNNIHIVGTIDNDTGGATIAINNGAVQLIYRNGWRII